jgi:2,3-bisphosphoglycerate-independent phosphoglycerate mutase
LEAARTPNLDFLARQGICGLITPCYRGSFPTSKDAHLSLFGYDLKKWNIGRGVFEVLGIGMKMKKEDVALRGNFATLATGGVSQSNLKIIDRRAGRIQNSEPLIRALQGIEIKGVRFLIGKGVSHRLGIIMRPRPGVKLSEKISDGDLHRVGIKPPKIRPLTKTKEAKFTAEVLNEFLERAHQILENHPLNKKRKKKGLLPANYILVRGVGKLRKIPSFQKKWKMKSCCIAGGVLYKGIGRVLGMDLIKVKGATGKADTNLKAKFEAAKKALKKYDFCYLHIKATDNFGHDGDCLGKRKFIEKVDRNLKPILSLENTLIVVTSDHSTPCQMKEHTPDPLPVLVYGGGKDDVKKFSEKECSKGKLGKLKSAEFLKRLKNLLK